MHLTQKERVIAQIEHRETDYIPYTIDGGEITGQLDEYFGTSVWREKIDSAIQQIPGPENLDVENEDGKYRRDWYGGIWRIDLRPSELVQPVLKQPSLKGYTFPNVDDSWNSEWKESALKFIEDNNQYFLTAPGPVIYERIWYMRGFANALLDVMESLKFYQELLDALVEHHMQILEKVLTLPVDGIMFADDWGMQSGVIIGADRWREIIKPRMSKLYHMVHEAGKYTLSHCCGSIADIMPDVIEIGLDVYESVQPEAKNNSPYLLKQKYGDKITFWGGLGSQSIIPFGTPQEIKQEVKRLCHEMGKGGGYILSPAKPFQPETPVENAVAVIEAFIEQAK
jgi:uroporphyrinogen decarboxylase